MHKLSFLTSMLWPAGHLRRAPPQHGQAPFGRPDDLVKAVSLVAAAMMTAALVGTQLGLAESYTAAADAARAARAAQAAPQPATATASKAQCTACVCGG